MRSLLCKLQAFVRAKRPPAFPATPLPNGRFVSIEWLGWVALAGLALFFLATSWRKWPDPLIDFGGQLYLPWRLAHGAVLYRDVEHAYGPLSPYLNAGLFKVFGPGIMVLVAANLVVFAGIAISIYAPIRRAWGAGAALVSSSIFVSVFGFAQYVGIGNYNYATPYSHEATHGFLVCLLLVAVLFRWVEHPTLLRSSLAGGLFGLTAVLKPEMMLAAGLVTFAAWAMRWYFRKSIPLAAVAAWAGCAVLPTLAFTAYFSAYLPWRDALPLACRAWLSVASSTRYTDAAIQRAFTGLGQARRNLAVHATATLGAILTVAGIAIVARMADRVTGLWRRVLLAGLLVGGVAGLGRFEIPWLQAGRCFLGLNMIYVLVCAISMARRSRPGALDQTLALRLLIALLAAALMARMFLNGRIYQYGFYQAALAGVLIPAIIVSELPARLALGRFGKTLMVAGSLILVESGVVTLSAGSQEILNLKTYPVGEAMDRFYCFPPDLDPRGKIMGTLVDRLAKGSPGQTLLVLPEGEMINYLARMPSPVAPFFFYSFALSGGREAALVNQLSEHPPDWVVIISRDLREYGIGRYGEAPGEGQSILGWVSENYQREMAVGGDPLDVGQAGGVLLKRVR
ncbi:MAG: hypothetical protein ABSB88_03185 [Bryobacteraceae bacterium]|jgi:hypothetical protein